MKQRKWRKSSTWHEEVSHAVQGCAHPADDGMPDPALHVPQDLPRIALEPVPVEGLGHDPQLDDKVAGEVFGFEFASFFTPEAKEAAIARATESRSSSRPIR